MAWGGHDVSELVHLECDVKGITWGEHDVRESWGSERDVYRMSALRGLPRDVSRSVRVFPLERAI